MAIGGILSVGILYRHVTVLIKYTLVSFEREFVGTSNCVARTRQGFVSTNITDKHVTVLMKCSLFILKEFCYIWALTVSFSRKRKDHTEIGLSLCLSVLNF